MPTRASWLVLVCALPAAVATVFLEEDFSGDWESRWVISDWKKKEKQQGKWKVGLGKHYLHKEGNRGLMTTEDSKFYAISTRFDPINMTALAAAGKPLIIQMLVKNEQNWRCAGSYLYQATRIASHATFRIESHAKTGTGIKHRLRRRTPASGIAS